MDTIIITIIVALCTVVNVYYTIKGSSRSNRQDIKENNEQVKAETILETRNSSILETKLDNVMHGIDDIKLDYREQSRHVNSLDSRLVANEESCKSAHKRIDEHISQSK